MVLESVVLLLGFFMGVSVRRERVGRAGFLDFSLNRLRGKKGYFVDHGGHSRVSPATPREAPSAAQRGRMAGA